MSESPTAPLAVIVLAAGQGTRMRSRLPKVLHPLAGQPLVGHVLRTARILEPARVAVVVRHERALVAEAVAALAPDAVVVDQDEIPGTGRAVELGLAGLDSFDGDVLVLSGDVPLLEAETLHALVETHRVREAAVTLLSAVLADPTGYGRVLRDASGDVERIVEQKDATDHEAEVAEINAGVYVFRAEALRRHLPEVGQANAQGEKYLTDVVALARRAGERIAVGQSPDPAAALGVNDRVQLAEAARILNARTVRRWQLAGASILDSRDDLDRRRRDPRRRRDGAAGHVSPRGDDRGGGSDDRARHEPDRLRGRGGCGRAPHGCDPGGHRTPRERRTVRLPPPRHDTRCRRQDRNLRRDEELADRRGQQGPAPLLHRRHDDRPRRQPRCRRDHRELRRCRQAPHRDR
ncbi:CTP:molybdopterin cytidylyltransferase MocA [Microbacterium sp. SORGH_AS 862]|nr:CTP:molybdopterin cytidylyltransferase MocA [Microbacterium sp. SORGH_AS_0862]